MKPPASKLLHPHPWKTAFRPGTAVLGAGAGRCKNWTLGNMMERRNLDIVPLLLGRTRIWAKNWLLWVLLLSIRLK